MLCPGIERGLEEDLSEADKLFKEFIIDKLFNKKPTNESVEVLRKPGVTVKAPPVIRCADCAMHVDGNCRTPQQVKRMVDRLTAAWELINDLEEAEVIPENCHRAITSALQVCVTGVQDYGVPIKIKYNQGCFIPKKEEVSNEPDGKN